MKKFFKIGCGGLLAIIILGAIFGALGGEETNQEASEEQTTVENEVNTEATAEVTEEAAEVTKEETEEESVPREYKAALKKAESYAKTMHMSKAGIYDQLTSEYGENFPAEAAQYAIDNIQWDWKENALKKAQS